MREFTLSVRSKSIVIVLIHSGFYVRWKLRLSQRMYAIWIKYVSIRNHEARIDYVMYGCGAYWKCNLAEGIGTIR